MNRILYLFTSYPIWSESFLRQDLSGLLNCGLPIKAASLFPGNCEVQPGWPIVHILTENKHTTGTSTQKPRRIKLPQFINAAISSLKHRKLQRTLEQYCQDECITHIHAECADLAAFLGYRVASHLNCTFSLGIHADDCISLKYPPATLFPNARFITVCNAAAANILRTKYPQYTDKLHLIHHGIDLNLWTFSQHHSPTNGLNILFAGRLVPKKGIDILIQALATLPQNYTLTIAGDGPEQHALQQLAQELNCAERISWLGRLSQQALKYTFGSSDVLVLPSLTSNKAMDGIPNIMLEAMASGLPVIAFDSGSISEVLTPNTGILITTPSQQSLTQALLQFPRINTVPLTQNARSLVEQQFSPTLLASQRSQLFS